MLAPPSASGVLALLEGIGVGAVAGVGGSLLAVWTVRRRSAVGR